MLTVIINPSMVATWMFGLWLAWDSGAFAAGWLQTKLVLVLAMSGLHGMCSRWVRDFAGRSAWFIVEGLFQKILILVNLEALAAHIFQTQSKERSDAIAIWALCASK